MKFEIGDHLISGRIAYTHHGIYIGDNKVIHYSGLADGLRGGPVEVTTLEKFAAGKKIRVRKYLEPLYSGQIAVERAYTRLGENRYDLHANNCEHFCTWVRTGNHVSSQVQFVETISGAIGAGLSEFRKQRFHKASATETALETGKAATRALIRTARGVPALRGLGRLLK
jgi:hypothetical protein